ncbi:MAG: L-fucose:H+ symporter permease [Lentisphaeria bacterium]|nr:L-fucose:H+ symporter permease [Lentisphaeria bacterium]
MKNNPSQSTSKKAPLLPTGMLVPFILVTSLFSLWGFANDITNPLVKAFQQIFLVSNAQSSLVQAAFYGGYATMAIPAALFIRRFSYKAGILIGLALYATGAFLTIPAAQNINFDLFLVALYILTFGLAFLETTANPYILTMGDQSTATRRLNMAQAFNPIGSLIGMIVASKYILTNLEVSKFREAQMLAHPEYANMNPGHVDGLITKALETLRDHSADVFTKMQLTDLEIVRTPYVIIGIIITTMFVIFALYKLPSTTHDKKIHLGETLRRIFKNKQYLEGLVAQTFYVAAQIMCWTFVIQYAMGTLKMSAAEAQNHNIIAMIFFCLSRFICTFLLKYISPGQLLKYLGLAAISATLGAIFLPGIAGLYSLLSISICMSLMFPTIYGIALDGMGEDAKIASAGLIFAIVGGCLAPPLQGMIIDAGDWNLGFMTLQAVKASFVLPLICFVVITIFGYRTFKIHQSPSEEIGVPGEDLSRNPVITES